MAFRFESLFLFRPCSFFGSGLLGQGGEPSPRAGPARARTGGIRAPGTGSGSGHSARRRCTQTPTHVHSQLQLAPAPHPHPLSALGNSRAPSGEEAANPGSPSAAPTPPPRLNDELSKKSAGAGGMFWGQTQIRSSAFLKGNRLRPAGLWWSGEGGWEQGGSSWDDPALGGWGDPGRRQPLSVCSPHIRWESTKSAARIRAKKTESCLPLPLLLCLRHPCPRSLGLRLPNLVLQHSRGTPIISGAL